MLKCSLLLAVWCAHSYSVVAAVIFVIVEGQGRRFIN